MLLCAGMHLNISTITYFYYFEQEKLWEGFKQLWATYPVAGNVYVAHPVGKEEADLNFYQAGGKFGLMAKHGMFEQLTGFQGMPGVPIFIWVII